MSEHFIGQPAVNLGGTAPYEVVTSDLLPTRQQVMGITVPNAWSAGVNWVQLPTADGANTGHMNAYGQWQNGAGTPVVGDWVEWHFGAMKPSSGVHLWAHLWTGPNLGKVDVSWNGVTKGTFDTYAASYTSGVGMYLALEALGTVPVPRKNTMRWTIVAKNASSTASFILLNSVSLYTID